MADPIQPDPNTGNNTGGNPMPPQGGGQTQGNQFGGQQSGAGQAQGNQFDGQGMPPPGYGYPPQGAQYGYAPPPGYGYPPQGGQYGYAPPPAGQGMPPPPPPGYGYPPQGGYPPMPPQDEGPITPIGNFGRDEKKFHSNIKIPEHSLEFDEQEFLCLLSGSISLTKDEKKRIIEAIPRLSQYQVTELMNILKEEKNKFSALDVKHKDQLKELEKKHAAEWDMLEMEMTQPEVKQQEEDEAEKLRKSLQMNKKDEDSDMPKAA